MSGTARLLVALTPFEPVDAHRQISDELRLGDEVLEPQRTLASYKIDKKTVLVLTVQGGNA